jgi:hypothetical protein
LLSSKRTDLYQETQPSWDTISYQQSLLGSNDTSEGKSLYSCVTITYWQISSFYTSTHSWRYTSQQAPSEYCFPGSSKLSFWSCYLSKTEMQWICDSFFQHCVQSAPKNLSNGVRDLFSSSSLEPKKICNLK